MVVIVRIPNDELLDRRELALDAVGNWKRFQQDGNGWEFNQSRTHTIANEIAETTGESWKQPSHDAAGNMTSAPAPGDETNTTHQYVYDAWNRLVAVWVDSDDNESRAGDGSEDIATYQYDGLGRRIVRTDCTADPDVVYHDYYTPSWQLIEVRKGGKADTDLHKQFVLGLRYIDAPILRDRETNAGSAGLDERLYYTQDGNFNVTALVNPAGDVVERYSYDAYGQVTVRNGAENVDPDTVNDPATEWDADNASDVDNRLLYCGYRYDSETGLYHVRFRYLHPTLGRWTTPDPAGYVDGMGLYEYSMSAPLNRVDPTGFAVKVPDGWTFWGWVDAQKHDLIYEDINGAKKEWNDGSRIKYEWKYEVTKAEVAESKGCYKAKVKSGLEYASFLDVELGWWGEISWSTKKEFKSGYKQTVSFDRVEERQTVKKRAWRKQYKAYKKSAWAGTLEGGLHLFYRDGAKLWGEHPWFSNNHPDAPKGWGTYKKYQEKETLWAEWYGSKTRYEDVTIAYDKSQYRKKGKVTKVDYDTGVYRMKGIGEGDRQTVKGQAFKVFLESVAAELGVAVKY